MRIGANRPLAFRWIGVESAAWARRGKPGVESLRVLTPTMRLEYPMAQCRRT